MGSVSKKTVFIDMDGVLVNYQKHYKDFNDLNFENMEPIEGSIDAFHELNKNHEVYIVSAPPLKQDYAHNQKVAWVRKMLGDEFEKKIVFTRNKGLLRGDYLIDDNTNKHGIDKFSIKKGQTLVHFNPGRSVLEEWVRVIMFINDGK